MTIDELLARESIRHTMAKYTISGDELCADDYSACFTEDAVLEFGNFPGQGDISFEGREAIHNWVAGWFGAIKSGKAELPGGRFMRHHLTTILIEFIDPESANTKVYCVEYSDNGAASGYYTDIFRKVGDRWLIARRKWTSDQ